MEYIFLISSIITGLCFGSFATMASYRIPRHEDIFIKRSYCTKCKKQIRALSLIPLLSWIFQFGKCSKCHAKISVRYPLIEISSSALFVISYLIFGISINTIVLDIFITILLTIVIMIIEKDIILFTKKKL